MLQSVKKLKRESGKRRPSSLLLTRIISCCVEHWSCQGLLYEMGKLFLMPFSAPYNFVACMQKASAAGEGKLCLSEEFFGPRVEVCVQSGSSVLPCAVPVVWLGCDIPFSTVSSWRCLEAGTTIKKTEPSCGFPILVAVLHGSLFGSPAGRRKLIRQQKGCSKVVRRSHCGKKWQFLKPIG